MPVPSSNSSNTFSTRRIAMLALFTAAALMIYAIESMLPVLIPVPGIKLGLANVVTLIVLKRYNVRDALLVLISRILLSAFFFGNLLSLLYSLCGGLFCLFILWLIDRLLFGNYLVLTSIMGAIAHNLAQILVAFFITSVPGVYLYLPFLMISACITGLFTGLCAQFTLKNLKGVRPH